MQRVSMTAPGLLAVLIFISVSSLAQQAAEAPSVNAKLGPCSASFQVVDQAGKPIPGAQIEADIPYHVLQNGWWKMKIASQQVVTDSVGKARVTGLPKYPPKFISIRKETLEEAEGLLPRTILFHVSRDQMQSSQEFEPDADHCQGDFRIVLGKGESGNSGTETKP